jgi:hypothetical protein
MKKPFTLDAAEIDWDLLRDQKADLNEALVSGAALTPKAQFSVSGIVELLDYIQDEAEKVIGETAVFGRES